MSEVTKKILDTIKGKNIKPKPRWHFIMRQVLIWFTSLLSIVVGSFAFSVILFRMVNNDWEVLKFINRSPVAHALNTLPYIWIVLLILFIALAYYNARHTKGAYKYQAYWFIVGSVVISIAVGGIFYAFGIGPRIHYAVEKIPFIKELMYDRDKIWMNADDGFIAGEVTEMLSGVGMFQLEDLDNKLWVVRPGDEYYPPPQHFIIEKGVMVRICGEKIDEDLFEAIKVMPYQMGPGIMKGQMPGFRKNGGPKKILFVK
jgi:hypothetical protein